jgi:hypothetical protein
MNGRVIATARTRGTKNLAVAALVRDGYDAIKYFSSRHSSRQLLGSFEGPATANCAATVAHVYY